MFVAETRQEAAILVFDRIPVRNVWLLFLYASDLARYRNRFDAEVEDSPNLKSLLARLLCYATERRLRRNLSFGYRARQDVLRRLRGRIDILRTESHGLFQRGEVACSFAELTVDTPRNRLVRAAHAKLASLPLAADLAGRCRLLARTMGRMGVGAELPSRAETASAQMARHDVDDRLMVSLARAVFDLILPTEESGARALLAAQREEAAFRELFEKAIRNVLRAELPREEGWRVPTSRWRRWQVDSSSPGIDTYLPLMEMDIIVDNVQTRRRTVIDTKFTEILKRSRHGGHMRFKTDHLYQIYAYVRSQERGCDPMSLDADGVLLYPAVGMNIGETAMIQGHRIRFVTVDLACPSSEVLAQVRAIPSLAASPLLAKQ